MTPWFITVKAKGNKTQNLITEYFLVDKIILHYEDAKAPVITRKVLTFSLRYGIIIVGLVDYILSNLCGRSEVPILPPDPLSDCCD